MRALLFLGCFLSSAWAEVSWPEFRGPSGDGVSRATKVPVRWSEQGNVRWKTALPGRGWSSPVVAEGRVWLTSAVESGEEKELLALQVDLATGALERKIRLGTIPQTPGMHKANSYASPTPAIREGYVVCHFGAFGTFCLAAESGELLWQTRYVIDHEVGPGSSPMVVDDLLILVCDGTDEQFVVALDLATGQEVWKTARPPLRTDSPMRKKAFSTPLRIDSAGREQLVIPAAQWLVSYDPLSGRELWRMDHGAGFSVVPRPVYGGGLLYFGTGYTKPEVWAVRVDGVGELGASEVVWREWRRMPTRPSPLLVNDLLFVITDGGVATCLDALTGESQWLERIPGNYSASPVFADGKIYFCSERGVTTVIEAGATFRELAKNELDGGMWASPAVFSGGLLLRTEEALYRIGE
ncbi:MAG: PQQ-binding-like beta-propeller repeat protein [Verrucomicrobiota bacterium]